MERKIKERPLSAGIHWLRLYHFQCSGVDAVNEALLDNETCPVLEQHCADFPWPKCEQFYSTRLFLIITDAPRSSEGVVEPVSRPAAVSVS